MDPGAVLGGTARYHLGLPGFRRGQDDHSHRRAMAELARPAVSGPPPELVSQPAPPRPGEIDSYLSYCLSAWQENVPWLASEWPSMDAVEREDNQLEWGI